MLQVQRFLDLRVEIVLSEAALSFLKDDVDAIFLSDICIALVNKFYNSNIFLPYCDANHCETEANLLSGKRTCVQSVGNTSFLIAFLEHMM